jgi:hypothetical protein
MDKCTNKTNLMKAGRTVRAALLFSFCAVAPSLTSAQTPKAGAGLNNGLQLHLKLAGTTSDDSRNKQAVEVQGNPAYSGKSTSGKVSLDFNGRDQWLQIPSGNALNLGAKDFTISTWVHTDDVGTDVLGDIASKYDRGQRKGFRLGFIDNAVGMSHANVRQLTFGIDNNKGSQWVDCGRPGEALIAFGMAEYQGKLYVGTCEPGKTQRGQVYVYEGDKKWKNCGSPDQSNAVMGMSVFEDELYVGTGKYRVGGSSLPESENLTKGGRIFRYKSGNQWEDVGQIPGAEAIGGMVVFNKDLYVSSLYSPGFYRYDKKANKWIDCGAPEGKRVVHLAVYNDYLYATCYDGGYVFRFDGKKWENCGLVGPNTQTYSFTVYEGDLHVATWPTGRVYRFEGVNDWKDIGRMGKELEVMGMAVHNGRFVGGTLPLAEIYSYEGDTTWKRLDQIDRTPDVRYRRAWTMAEHNGKLYCTTLPSGHVYAYEAGKNVTWSKSMPSGWHHVTAIRKKDRLELHVDGNLVAQSGVFNGSDFDLSAQVPFKVGFGPNDYLKGKLRDFRVYERALTTPEIKSLAAQK